MRKFGSESFIHFNTEIECTCRRYREEKRLVVNRLQEGLDDLEVARARNITPPNEHIFNNPMVVNQPMVLRDYATPSIGI